jgi:hypothetical protein
LAARDRNEQRINPAREGSATGGKEWRRFDGINRIVRMENGEGRGIGFMLSFL